MASRNWTLNVHSVENSRRFYISDMVGTWEPYRGGEFFPEDSFGTGVVYQRSDSVYDLGDRCRVGTTHCQLGKAQQNRVEASEERPPGCAEVIAHYARTGEPPAYLEPPFPQS